MSINSVKWIIDLRKRRANLFPGMLFSDHAWDFLLEVYVYGQNSKILTVSQLAHKLDIRFETAVRWGKLLEENDLISVNYSENVEGVIALMPSAIKAVEQLFSENEHPLPLSRKT